MSYYGRFVNVGGSIIPLQLYKQLMRYISRGCNDYDSIQDKMSRTWFYQFDQKLKRLGIKPEELKDIMQEIIDIMID